jgi:hypothetical protein
VAFAKTIELDPDNDEALVIKEVFLQELGRDAEATQPSSSPNN